MEREGFQPPPAPASAAFVRFATVPRTAPGVRSRHRNEPIVSSRCGVTGTYRAIPHVDEFVVIGVIQHAFGFRRPICPGTLGLFGSRTLCS